MRWDIEELTEDAFVALLRPKISGNVRVFAAWERESMEYPCVMAFANEASPVSDSADWHDPRVIGVRVLAMTELAPELASDGEVLRTPREINADVRSQVGAALCVTDLLAQLIDNAPPGVAFSMAQVSSVVRSLEGTKLVTTYHVEVIAEPVEV